MATKSAKNVRPPTTTVTATPTGTRPAPLEAPSHAPTLGSWLIPAYVGLIFLGYALLRAPGATSAGQEMGEIRGLFTAVNMATLTGFPQIDNIQTFATMGQAVVLGMIVLGSVFTLIIGGTAMSRILRLGYSDRQILRAAIVAQTAALGVGTFLWLFDEQRSIIQAVFMTASAFGNAGAVLGAYPDPHSWQTHLIILPLAVLGGLGLCVLMELFDYLRGRIARLSAHSIAVLGSVAWIYIGGTLLLAALGCSAGSDWRELIVSGAAANLASRSLGMGLANLNALSRPAVWTVVLLMIIGTASGGTGGGIKTNSLLSLFYSARAALNGRAVGRALGIALVWIGIYALLLFVGFLSLLHLMPQTPVDHVLLLAVSAAGNVGLSPDPLSPDRGAAFVLCAVMLIGRFAPLMVLWWMTDTTSDSELAVG